MPRLTSEQWYPVNANQEARLARIRNSRPEDARWATYSQLITCGYRLTGPLDRARLCAAVERVTARHTAFRAVFDWTTYPARQRLGPEPPRLEILAGVQDDDELRTLLSAPIDLAAGPMARFVVAERTGGAELWLTIEHMVADGWSVDLLCREIAQAYSDPSGALPAVAVQNHEVGLLEQRHCASTAGQAARAYWLDALGDHGPWAPFWYPASDHLSAHDPAAGCWEEAVLAADEAPLGLACRRARTTPYVLVLASLCRVIAQRTGWDVVPVWSPTANRWSADLQSAITFASNVLPLPLTVDALAARPATVQQVKHQVTEALSHGSYPIHRLIREVTPELWGGAQPAPYLYVAVETDEAPPAFAGLALSPLPPPPPSLLLGLVMWCLVSEAGLTIRLGCRTGFLPPAELRSIADAGAAEIRMTLRDLAG